MNFGRLDFAPPRSRWPAWLLGASLCGFLLVGLVEQAQLARQRSLAEQRLRALSQTRAPVAAPTSARSKAQVKAMRMAVEALNRPWPELLTALESARDARVQLLAIEARPEDRMLRITAGAEQMDELIDYMHRLGSLSPFVRAIPLRQELSEQGGGPRMLAAFELQWDEMP